MGYKDSFTAGAAIVKGRFVKLVGATIIHCAASTDKAIGVSLHDAEIGDLVAVQLDGEVDVEQGAVLTRGGDVMTDADGRAIDHTGANIVQGLAREVGVAASGGVHALASINLFPNKVAP